MAFLIKEDVGPFRNDSDDDSDISDVELREYRLQAKGADTGLRRDLAASTRALLQGTEKTWQLWVPRVPL